MTKQNNISKVKKFIKKYKKYYTKSLIHEKNLFYGFSSEVNQIFAHFGITPLENTDYYEFYQILKKFFDLKTTNILEITSGPIPILASIIRNKEDISITAINKKIIFKNYKNVTTIQKDLNYFYNIQKYDLIIGFRPCETTEKMINLAIKYKKDFCFYLCPCVFKPKKTDGNEPWGQRKWHNYLINIILQNKNYDLKIIKSKKLLDDCPVLIAKYKKL